MGSPAGEHGVSVETITGGAPGPNEPAPRSDAPQPSASADPFARTATPAADPNELKPAVADPNELKPSTPADPNELKPSIDTQSAASTAAAPPVQVNEIQQGQSPSGDNATSSSSTELASERDISSSKKKKKKGLKKVISF